MFRATLTSPSLLVNSISTIAELIDEGLFKISKDGISLTAADRAMVVVVDFNLSSTAFQSYEIDEERTIGLNVSNFLQVLKRASGNDKVTLTLTEKQLIIQIENGGKRRFHVPLIDLSKEEVPNIESLEFTSKSELKPEVLQSGIEDAEIIADSILFQTTPNKFFMHAEGDISRTELELEKGNDGLINLETEDDTKSRYPLDYLKKMIKAGKIADSVTLQFAQDYPMKIGFKSGDKMSLQFVLAPRVSEE